MIRLHPAKPHLVLKQFKIALENQITFFPCYGCKKKNKRQKSIFKSWADSLMTRIRFTIANVTTESKFFNNIWEMKAIY